MYGAIWRALPGPTGVRVALAVLLALAVVAVLWFLVFPWVGEHLSYDPTTTG